MNIYGAVVTDEVPEISPSKGAQNRRIRHSKTVPKRTKDESVKITRQKRLACGHLTTARAQHYQWFAADSPFPT